MQDYRKMRVWRKSHELVIEVYGVTQAFPEIERFGLVQQLRKAAISIAANLVEGSSRRGDAEFRRFVSISMGSASEVEYHLLLSRDLGYLDQARHDRLGESVADVRRMLCGLSARLCAGMKDGRGVASK